MPPTGRWNRAVLGACAIALVIGASCCRGQLTREATLPPAGTDLDPCYPYRPTDAGCPTECRSIEDCAGSRGPGDFNKNGWPLDCINGECVPLHPDVVVGDP